MYDKDGFFVLIPAKSLKKSRKNNSILSSDSTKNNSVTASSHVGKYTIEMKVFSEQKGSNFINSDKSCLRIQHGGNVKYNQLCTGIPMKSWKHKAWNNIDINMPNWHDKSPFIDSNLTLNQKGRHLKAVTVSMKVFSSGGKNGKYIHSRLINEKDKSSGNQYITVYSPRDFKSLMEKIYRMIYVKCDDYIADSIKRGYTTLCYTMKAMMVYDDLSYDCIVGNPCEIFKLYGLKFSDDGRMR